MHWFRVRVYFLGECINVLVINRPSYFYRFTLVGRRLMCCVTLPLPRQSPFSADEKVYDIQVLF